MRPHYLPVAHPPACALLRLPLYYLHRFDAQCTWFVSCAAQPWVRDVQLRRKRGHAILPVHLSLSGRSVRLPDSCDLPHPNDCLTFSCCWPALVLMFVIFHGGHSVTIWGVPARDFAPPALRLCFRTRRLLGPGSKIGQGGSHLPVSAYLHEGGKVYKLQRVRHYSRGCGAPGATACGFIQKEQYSRAIRVELLSSANMPTRTAPAPGF